MRHVSDMILFLKDTQFNSVKNVFVHSNKTEMSPETYNTLVNFTIDELFLNFYDILVENRKTMIKERQLNDSN